MNRILIGDVLTGLAQIPDGCVQTCVTSPPYYGLRDYGTATWEGGDPDCDHNQSRRGHSGEKQATSEGTSRDSLAGLNSCRWCGARRTDNQIGLEPTPEEYVSRLVEVFREVRRVLRDDGTLWLNMGDSYAGSRCGPSSNTLPGRRRNHYQAMTASRRRDNAEIPRSDLAHPGLKPKDMLGIPWMLAFALRADGWYLRQDIIWHKPNPMPESVKDRCTKAHEYIFLLSKSAKYFYDAEAVMEAVSHPHMTHKSQSKSDAQKKAFFGNAPSNMGRCGTNPDGRNRRSVWTVATRPYKCAHFATFPEALVEPCIRAGSRPGDTVLDPFLGAGTTALVAEREGRQWIGCELNPDYVAIAERRLRGVQKPLLLE